MHRNTNTDIEMYHLPYYLKNSLIKLTRRYLQRMVGAIVECPSSAHCEAHLCAGLEHCPNPRPSVLIHRLVH